MPIPATGKMSVIRTEQIRTVMKRKAATAIPEAPEAQAAQQQTVNVQLKNKNAMITDSSSNDDTSNPLDTAYPDNKFSNALERDGQKTGEEQYDANLSP